MQVSETAPCPSARIVKNNVCHILRGKAEISAMLRNRKDAEKVVPVLVLLKSAVRSLQK